MPKRNRPEGDLVRACLAYLEAAGVFAWRNNSGMAMLPGRGGKPQPVRFGGMPGASDILGVLLGGRFLAVECKVGKGKLSEAQRRFLERVDQMGGLALVVRDDVNGLVEEIEKVTP